MRRGSDHSHGCEPTSKAPEMANQFACLETNTVARPTRAGSATCRITDSRLICRCSEWKFFVVDFVWSSEYSTP